MKLVRESGKRTRYYSIALYPTLFNDFLLVRHYGDLNSPHAKKSYFGTKKEALLFSLNLAANKRSQGYKVLSLSR